jgi:hypothetical protein
MDIPKDPLEAFWGLPQEVQNWYEKLMVEAAWENGLDHDFGAAWNLMTRAEQWKTVAMLIKESAPKDQPCPRVTLSKRAAPLKTPSLQKKSEQDCVPVPSQFAVSDFGDNTETEKVKKILLNWSKVRFIGNEGSGKTSKARWLCRQRIPLGHQIYWINPHLNAEDKQKLDALNVVIVGGGRDYAAIARFCHQMVVAEDSELNKAYERYGSEIGAKFPPKTFVFDELTNYKDQEVLKAPIQIVMKASMQEFSKIDWSSIYITHNDTLSCMAMPDGTRNLVDSSVFDLQLEADINLGNRVPKAIAKYRMPNTSNWLDVKIPVDWQ